MQGFCHSKKYFFSPERGLSKFAGLLPIEKKLLGPEIIFFNPERGLNEFAGLLPIEKKIVGPHIILF